jgi:hypothetical protein
VKFDVCVVGVYERAVDYWREVGRWMMDDGCNVGRSGLRANQ